MVKRWGAYLIPTSVPRPKANPEQEQATSPNIEIRENCS